VWDSGSFLTFSSPVGLKAVYLSLTCDQKSTGRTINSSFYRDGHKGRILHIHASPRGTRPLPFTKYKAYILIQPTRTCQQSRRQRRSMRGIVLRPSQETLPQRIYPSRYVLVCMCVCVWPCFMFHLVYVQFARAAAACNPNLYIFSPGRPPSLSL